MSTVRTAVTSRWGEAPTVLDMPAPQPAPGRTLVQMLAAGVNPVDIAIGNGKFYMPLPDPPTGAGVEAVGRVLDSQTFPEGSLVWCLRHTGGCWAARFSAADDTLVPVADGSDPVLAVAMGVAGLAGWMPVVTRGGLSVGETVVVLGATGVVGQVALQAARSRGAGRIVAVGRDQGRLDELKIMGVDAIVPIDGHGDLAARIAEVCPERINLVVDALWGEPLAATIGSLAHGARIVQVGSASGATCTLPGGPLRGGRIDIRGFSVFSETREQRANAHADLVRAAREGAIGVPITRYHLDEASDAWNAQAHGTAGAKIVLVPDA